MVTRRRSSTQRSARSMPGGTSSARSTSRRQSQPPDPVRGEFASKEGIQRRWTTGRTGLLSLNGSGWGAAKTRRPLLRILRPRVKSLDKVPESGALAVALSGLGTVTDAELVQDVADVRLDGPRRNRERVGNLAVGQAVGQHRQHVVLARRQAHQLTLRA